MCSPAFPLEWLVLDTAYVLALLGGCLVMRISVRSPFAWILFGLLSAVAGGFCIVGTQAALANFGVDVVASASGGGASLQPC